MTPTVWGKCFDGRLLISRYMDPTLLAQCVASAQSKGWNAGIMVWQWIKVSKVRVELTAGCVRVLW
jgi:hypothetical protein